MTTEQSSSASNTPTSPAETDRPAREYDVPPDADAFDCPYCDVIEPREDLLTLHVGHEHESLASEAELDDFEKTFERESNDVFIYHLKVIVMVVAIYFVFLFAYSAVP